MRGPRGKSRRARQGVRAAAAVLFALVAVPSVAQSPQDLTQLSLEDLMQVEVETVSGASRYQQRLSEAPASVTVITGDEVLAYGCRTLSDVLQLAAGFYGSYDRNYNYLGVRGFARAGDYNARVLILVDNHRLNDNVYDQAPVGTEFPLDLALIDRVEVIRGPNSSLYGTSALLAAVNIVTRRGRALRGGAVTVGGGSLGTATFESRIGGSFHGAEGLLSASAYSSNGQASLRFPEFDAPGAAPSIAEKEDGDRAVRLFGSLDFRGLRLRTAFGTRKKHVPTAPYGTIFNDPRLWSVDARGYVDLQYRREVSLGSLTARLYYDRYRYDAEYPYEGEAGGSYLNRDRTLGSWGGGEIFFTSAARGRHRLTVGGEFARQSKEQLNFDVQPLVYSLDDHRRSNDWALYAQDHFRVVERFALNASMRVDHRGSIDPTVSPRLAAIVDISPRTTVKGLYGHVYRFPNAYEQYYYDSQFGKTNPNLEPESVHTWEVQFDQRFGPRARLAVGAFESRIADLIQQEVDPADGLSMFANLQSVRARGLEVEFDVRRQEGAPLLRGSYALQWSQEPGSAIGLTNSPRNLAHVAAILPFAPGKATVAADVQYIGARSTLSGRTVSGAWLVNANLSRRSLLPHVDGSLGVRNLFGTVYADPASVEHRQDALRQDGRTFRLALTYRFGG